jgi:hypothetical protein
MKIEITWIESVKIYSLLDMLLHSVAFFSSFSHKYHLAVSVEFRILLYNLLSNKNKKCDYQFDIAVITFKTTYIS